MNKPFLIPPAELEGIGFTADEFEAMAASGAFAGMQVELAGGELVKAGGSAGFTADEFEAMVGGGVFGGMRVELMGGRLVRMAPSYSRHGAMVARLTGRLHAIVGDEGGLFLDTMVETEAHTVLGPDIALAPDVVPDRGRIAAARLQLAIEVADSSLSTDLRYKAAEYARAGVPHYWVVDVVAAVTFVFAVPTPQGYDRCTRVRFTEPLSVPGHAAMLTLA